MGYIGAPVHLPSEAEAAKGGAESATSPYCICQRTLNSQFRGEPKGPNVAGSRRGR
jgi:hypothetical protein